MKIHKHNLIMIDDKNGIDVVGKFLMQLNMGSKHSFEAKLHLMFLHSAFNLLSVEPLEELTGGYTQLLITFEGQDKIKSYELVKALRVSPVHELRYAMNGNEHLRFLFFPFEFKGQSNYIFVEYFKITRSPNIDDTNIIRDLTYQMYLKVRQKPEYYLSEEKKRDLLDLTTSMLQESQPDLKVTLEGLSPVYAEIIFSRRMDLGYTQAKLAEVAGVGLKTISRAEGGFDNLYTEIYNEIFHALKLSVRQVAEAIILIGEDEEALTLA